MKLNSKGFAISSIMYVILILAVILISITLALLSSRKLVLDKLKQEVLNEVQKESFNEDSWTVIAENVRTGNTSMYNVGDTKEVELDGYGLFTVRIANMSTPSECNNSNFSQTACGFVVEFTDIITTHAMNSTDTNIGGWESSEMRSYVNNDILNSFPEELKELIIDTKVASGHGPTTGESNFVTTDKVYLLATAEVWENGSLYQIKYDTARELTRQLDYYKNLGVTTDRYEGANKNDSYWWLRSAIEANFNNFYGVHDIGDCSSYTASDGYGVSVAFRIG